MRGQQGLRQDHGALVLNEVAHLARVVAADAVKHAQGHGGDGEGDQDFEQGEAKL